MIDKEWKVEATIEIKTSFFCDTKEEAEKMAHCISWLHTCF